MYQSISVFLDIAKFDDFWGKKDSRTREACHVIHIFSWIFFREAVFLSGFINVGHA